MANKQPENNKRGYLSQQLNFFVLHDNCELHISSHYHDFNKIVLFNSGQVTYFIDGCNYTLYTGDILLIQHDTIHKPAISTAEPYDRIIIWFKPSLLETYDSSLLNCFTICTANRHHLLNPQPPNNVAIRNIISQLPYSLDDTQFGASTLRIGLFLQLMVYLNRAAAINEKMAAEFEQPGDHIINKALYYIDGHMADDLSIDKLAGNFFISKYYLMRRFKRQTGYSIHQYVMQKRLLHANSLIKSGFSVLEACLESGFHDYSSFTRAFKKVYGTSPSKYQKSGEA